MKNLTPYSQFINEAEVPVEQNALAMVDRAMLGIKSMTEMIRKNPEYNGQSLQLSVPAIESAQKLYQFLAKSPGLISPETTKQLLTLAKLDWSAATLGKILDVYGKILVQIKKECEAKLADKDAGDESKAAIDHKHIQLGMPKINPE
jgi:hypothetical protein